MGRGVEDVRSDEACDVEPFPPPLQTSSPPESLACFEILLTNFLGSLFKFIDLMLTVNCLRRQLLKFQQMAYPTYGK